MSANAHLEELTRKHEMLEARLHDAQLHPATSDDEIRQLKHEKLKIKDEMARTSA